MPLGRDLWIQTQTYRLTVKYVLFLWANPFSNQISNPFRLYPGTAGASYILVFQSSQEVINILDNGHNMIWSNMPAKLQAWLRLVSALVGTPKWKQYKGRGICMYLSPSRRRARIQDIHYCAAQRRFVEFVNAAPATARRTISFSPTIWNTLL